MIKKEPIQSKYQLLINRRKNVGIKELKNSKPFIDYSQTINVVYENLEDYNPTKKIADSLWWYDSKHGS